MSGYIGNIPVPQATQTRQSFTATASQTTFNTAGYSPGYIDVFLNGVKLAPADYTATNGSDVVLAVGAASNDILEIVAYEIFQVVDQAFTGNFSVDSPTFVVDSTNNRVGIGTSSPIYELDVGSGSGSNSINIFSGSTDTSSVYFTDSTTGVGSYIGRLAYNHTADAMLFTTNASERMRIDSSGNVGIGTSSPIDYYADNLVVSASGEGGITIAGPTTGENYIMFADGTSGTEAYRGFIGYNHALDQLRFGTSGSEAMRIASTGELLVGTTSDTMPAAAAAGQAIMAGTRTFIATETGGDTILGGTTGSNYTAIYQGGTERMRIDSSGNLLVGKTAQNIGSVGVTIVDGQISSTVDGDATLRLNRLNSEGNIVQIRQAGDQIGHIFSATNGTLFYGWNDSGDKTVGYGVGDTGIKINDSVDAVYPAFATTGANRDNAIDIGRSTVRFKDLYLSGGVYLGGTGSANKLDDYEEGTFTPQFSTASTYYSQVGHYTKIGDVVTVTLQLDFIQNGTTFGGIGALPFTVAYVNYAGISTREYYSTGNFFVANLAIGGTGSAAFYSPSNSPAAANGQRYGFSLGFSYKTT